nr:hypothetical protein [uncultured Ralstonia sp.]
MKAKKPNKNVMIELNKRLINSVFNFQIRTDILAAQSPSARRALPEQAFLFVAFVRAQVAQNSPQQRVVSPCASQAGLCR